MDSAEKMVLVTVEKHRRIVSFSSEPGSTDAEILSKAVTEAFRDVLKSNQDFFIQVKNEQWGGVFIDVLDKDIADKAIINVVLKASEQDQESVVLTSRRKHCWSRMESQQEAIPADVVIEKRNGGCGVIFQNKLYVWGGNTTEKQRPFAGLQLSDSEDDSNTDDEDDPFDPNLEIERVVILPKPSDPDHPFDVLDLYTQRWSKQPTTGDFPKLGYGSSLNVHPPTHCLYLYAGWNEGQFDTEVYRVKVDEWKWKIVQPSTGVKPSPRYLTGVLIHGDLMSVFGGVGKDIVANQDPGAEYKAYVENGVRRSFGWNNEYYEFNLSTSEWTAPLGKHAKRPDPIGTFAFTRFDRDRTIMFGGSGSNGRVNEVYLFNLKTRRFSGPFRPPSPEHLWPNPSRFSTLTPLVDPDRVGCRLANGHGPVLKQKLILLWGKATSQLICPDTWQLEIEGLESEEEENAELKWTRLLVPLKPRSWHIARPVYIPNSTECDVVIFGGNVHIEGHLGDRNNTADLRILSYGLKTLVNQCLSVVTGCEQLHAVAERSIFLPPTIKAQVRAAVKKTRTRLILLDVAETESDQADYEANIDQDLDYVGESGQDPKTKTAVHVDWCLIC